MTVCVICCVNDLRNNVLFPCEFLARLHDCTRATTRGRFLRSIKFSLAIGFDGWLSF
jgi:hypothetical protein